MESSKDNKKLEQPQMCSGPTGFIFIFLAMVTVYVMFNMELRMKLAKGLGVVLYPIIGFDGQVPIITLLLGAFLLVGITTTVRHFQTDWITMAKNQKETKAVNKALRKAKVDGDSRKEKEIMEYQQKIMGKQQNMMFGNLKTMISTLLIVIIIFTWIWGDFIVRLDPPIISAFWDFDLKMTTTTTCCIIPFPNWMFVYMLISIPLGLLLQHSLKMYTFRKKLKETSFSQRKSLKMMLSDLELALESLEEEVEFPLTYLKTKLDNAKTKHGYGDTDWAEREARLIRSAIVETKKTMDLATEKISQVEKKLRKTKKDGMYIGGLVKNIKMAKQDISRGKFKDAVEKANRSIKDIQIREKKFLEAGKNLDIIKVMLYDLRNTPEASSLEDQIQKIESHMKKGNYNKANDLCNTLKQTMSA